MNERDVIIKIAAKVLLEHNNTEKTAAAGLWKNLFKYLGLANLVGIPLAYGAHKSNVNKAREEGALATYQRLMPWMMALNAPQGNLSSPFSFQNPVSSQQFNPSMMG